MKKLLLVFSALILVFIFSSCRRSELTISQVLAQPYMKSNGDMGMSLYLRTSITDAEKTKLHITDPTSQLSWTISANQVEFEDLTYLGSSDIAMPSGNNLPVGKWKLELISKDGRTIGETFDIDYRLPEVIPEGQLPFFDPETNLTFI